MPQIQNIVRRVEYNVIKGYKDVYFLSNLTLVFVGLVKDIPIAVITTVGISFTNPTITSVKLLSYNSCTTNVLSFKTPNCCSNLSFQHQSLPSNEYCHSAAKLSEQGYLYTSVCTLHVNLYIPFLVHLLLFLTQKLSNVTLKKIAACHSALSL